MKNNTSILLYPAGIPQKEAFIEARRQGLKIITVDSNPEAPLKSSADEFHHINPGDDMAFTEFVTQYTANNPLDGILVVGCDLPLSCALGGGIIGSPTISPDAARLTLDKLAMKQHLLASNVLVPSYYEVRSEKEVKAIIEREDCRMIIKPNDNCGARGIMQLKPGDDYGAAFNYALLNTKKDRKVILEKFIEGPQISIEGLVYNGEAVVTGFADRNYEYIDRFFPHIIENGASMPTLLSNSDKQAVIEEFVKGIHALGIDQSVAKGDMVIGKEGPMVIEIAGRISGGKFASQLVPQSSGVNLLEAAIKLATGKDPDLASLQPSFEKGVAVRYLFPPSGKVISVSGVEEVQNSNGIVEVVVVVSPGDLLEDITCHADRGGWLVATGDSREAAVKNAETAIGKIQFEVEMP